MLPAVLIVDDETTFAKNVATFLARHGYDVARVETAEEGLAQLAEFKPAIVLLDFNLPGMDGLEMLAELKRRDRGIKVVLITGQGNEQVAVDAMKAGAHDYLTKPLVLSKLKLVLDKALGQERLQEELDYYRSRAASGAGLASLVGESAPMQALKAAIRRVLAAEAALADADAPAVLVTGETGTGKELVARALHFDGPRRDRPFVEFNCANIPPHLVEAELFGYERGAFTDAKERKPGLIETAEGGTLFLDEIGDIDPTFQVKLLTLLENKRVRRLGSVREHRANVRIVTATNKPLEAMVQAGKFRSDLFFRLRIVELAIPPLRERGADVRLLADHYLALHAARYGKPGLAFTAAARARIDAHRWPGNVRELRNVIEQCVIMAEGDAIGPDDLLLPALAPAGTGMLSAPVARAIATPATSAPGAGLAGPARNTAGNLEAGSGGPADAARDPLNLPQMERELLERALAESGWNITQAAKLLGVSRDTLRYRIEKFGLARP